MHKKLFISVVLLAAIIFSFSVCFANNAGDKLRDAGDNVRNAVGGVENTIEDAARGVSNTSRNITGNMEEGANNIGNAMTDNNTMTNNNENTGMSIVDKGRDGAYTATRTSTDTTGNTLMGMNATTWTWLIIGIAAIAIVALVWYYAMQMRSSNYDNRD